MKEILRNVLYYIEATLKRPLWAIGPAAGTLAIGGLILFNQPQTYRSEAQLLIEAPQARTSLIPSSVAHEHLQFVEQRVLARDNLVALAEKLDLFPELRKVTSESRLAQLIRQQISIQTVATEASERYSGTTAMRISFSAPTAKQASAAVTELVDMIAQENRRQRIQRASEMSDFLSRELAKMTDNMNAREAEWKLYFEENADALPGRIESLNAELDAKDREVSALDQSIATLDNELRLLEAELRLGLERPETSARDSEQLAELESDLVAKSATYADAHPEIRSLKQRIDGLRRKIAMATSHAVGDRAPPTRELALIGERVEIARARQATLVAKRDEVNERIAWLRSTAARAPAVERQIEAIARERESLQRGLDEMRGRLSTARIGEHLELDNSKEHVQILEQPETPRFPSSPRRSRIMLLLIAAAAAAGAGGVYLGDTMRRTVRGTFDLTAQLNEVTLVVIPRWYGSKDRKSLADAIASRIARLIGSGSAASA